MPFTLGVIAGIPSLVQMFECMGGGGNEEHRHLLIL